MKFIKLFENFTTLNQEDLESDIINVFIDNSYGDFTHLSTVKGDDIFYMSFMAEDYEYTSVLNNTQDLYSLELPDNVSKELDEVLNYYSFDKTDFKVFKYFSFLKGDITFNIMLVKGNDWLFKIFEGMTRELTEGSRGNYVNRYDYMYDGVTLMSSSSISENSFGVSPFLYDPIERFMRETFFQDTMNFIVFLIDKYLIDRLGVPYIHPTSISEITMENFTKGDKDNNKKFEIDITKI